MVEKRCLKLVWLVLSLMVICVFVWRLSGCPGPPNCYVPYVNYLPLVAGNATTAGPPYPIHILPSHDHSTLLDLDNFTFLTKGRCNTTELLVLVHSAPLNTYNRRMIRSTWAKGLNVVFLVGETNDTRTQSELDFESSANGDIVQGSFVDSYRNMTYKHVMGLKWAAYFCPAAKYILKTDDDVFVNTPFLKEFISYELIPLGGRRLLMCNVIPRMLVRRTYRSKWRVSFKEYPGRWYPDYCAGWVILYSPDVAFTLYSEAQRSAYFWIDDVYITGILASSANLTHTSFGPLSILDGQTSSFVESGGKGKPVFLFSLTSPELFGKLWDIVNSIDY